MWKSVVDLFSCGVVVMVVVVGRMQLWLMWLPCLGDMACHLTAVGTLFPNLHHHSWAGSSVVKCMLIMAVKG
jgi:hypothetical protein